jgi:hypothetical protein
MLYSTQSELWVHAPVKYVVRFAPPSTDQPPFSSACSRNNGKALTGDDVLFRLAAVVLASLEAQLGVGQVPVDELLHGVASVRGGVARRRRDGSA